MDTQFPPNYRKAESTDRECSNCRYFLPVSGGCRRYNIVVNGSYVCREWESKMSKTAEELHPLDIEYLVGFVEKCAAMGVDPEVLLKKAAGGDADTAANKGMEVDPVAAENAKRMAAKTAPTPPMVKTTPAAGTNVPVKVTAPAK